MLWTFAPTFHVTPYNIYNKMECSCWIQWLEVSAEELQGLRWMSRPILQFAIYQLEKESLTKDFKADLKVLPGTFGGNFGQSETSSGPLHTMMLKLTVLFGGSFGKSETSSGPLHTMMLKLTVLHIMIPVIIWYQHERTSMCVQHIHYL